MTTVEWVFLISFLILVGSIIFVIISTLFDFYNAQVLFAITAVISLAVFICSGTCLDNTTYIYKDEDGVYREIDHENNIYVIVEQTGE